MIDIVLKCDQVKAIFYRVMKGNEKYMYILL